METSTFGGLGAERHYIRTWLIDHFFNQSHFSNTPNQAFSILPSRPLRHTHTHTHVSIVPVFFDSALTVVLSYQDRSKLRRCDRKWERCPRRLYCSRNGRTSNSHRGLFLSSSRPVKGFSYQLARMKRTFYISNTITKTKRLFKNGESYLLWKLFWLS